MKTNLSDFIKSKKMPIIVSLPENNVELAKIALDAGADALKVHINVNHRASGNEFKDTAYYLDIFKEIRTLYEGPLGIVLSDDVNKIDDIDLTQLKQIGFTYFSLYAKDITSKLLLQDELEKTVAVGDLFDPQHAKTLEMFNLEAVELSVVKPEDYGTPLNFDDLISYANYRQHTDLPLMIPSQKKMKPHDLQTLHNIGIDSVMLGAMTIGTTKESIYNTVSEFSDYASYLK